METPLERLRLLKSFSKSDVAKAVGCDKSHYGNIEAGKAVPSAALAQKIACFFGNEISEQQIIYALRYTTPAPPMPESELAILTNPTPAKAV